MPSASSRVTSWKRRNWVEIVPFPTSTCCCTPTIRTFRDSGKRENGGNPCRQRRTPVGVYPWFYPHRHSTENPRESPRREGRPHSRPVLAPTADSPHPSGKSPCGILFDRPSRVGEQESRPSQWGTRKERMGDRNVCTPRGDKNVPLPGVNYNGRGFCRGQGPPRPC